MAAPPSLVAVVVTCNRLAELQVTLARLCAVEARYLTRIVVVNNASHDGTGEWLARQDDPRLVVVPQTDNIGGAGGFEVGIRHAAAAFDPDWIVVMDDDARPEAGALEAFGTSARDGAEGWAAAVYDPQGAICDVNCPWVNPFWHRDVFWRTTLGMLRGRARGVFHLVAADYAAAQPRAVDGTSFVGFFISRAGIARAGFPDGNLFIYGDDVLYTLKLTAGGGRILFDPAVRFEHAYSTQSGGAVRIRPLWKCYYRYRNQMMIYRLCAGGWFVLVAPMMAAKWLAQVRHYAGERQAYLGLTLRALRDGILRRTGAQLAQVKRWAGENQGG